MDCCYICGDEDDEDELKTDLCACTDRLLHLKCQMQLLRRCSRDGRCTVCRTTYKNVRVTTQYKCSMRAVCGYLAHASLLIFACIAFVDTFSPDGYTSRLFESALFQSAFASPTLFLIALLVCFFFVRQQTLPPVIVVNTKMYCDGQPV